MSPEVLESNLVAIRDRDSGAVYIVAHELTAEQFIRHPERAALVVLNSAGEAAKSRWTESDPLKLREIRGTGYVRNGS